MKNIFDYNITTELHDGNIFYSRRISKELEEKIDANFIEYFETEEQYMPPVIVKILELLCMIVACGGVLGVTRAFKDDAGSLSQAFSNAPWFFIIIVIAIVALVVIHVHDMKSKAAFAEQVEAQGTMAEMNDLANLAEEELGLPADRFEMETYCHQYEMKDGKKKVQDKDFWMNNFLDAYEKDECLCFFDGRQEFSIPFEAIKTVEVEKKRMRIMEWLKDEDYKDRKFKEYKIVETNVGLVIPEHYQISIVHDGQQFEIIVPNYEEEAMRKIVEMIKPYKQ